MKELKYNFLIQSNFGLSIFAVGVMRTAERNRSCVELISLACFISIFFNIYLSQSPRSICMCYFCFVLVTDRSVLNAHKREMLMNSMKPMACSSPAVAPVGSRTFLSSIVLACCDSITARCNLITSQASTVYATLGNSHSYKVSVVATFMLRLFKSINSFDSLLPF